MPYLKLEKGYSKEPVIELTNARTVLGRHPTCEVILENAAVSRQHAQIIERQGRFFLEDLRSRNNTHLNGEEIDGRAELNDADEIEICDTVFTFHLTLPETTVLAIAELAPLKVQARDATRKTIDDVVLDPDAEEIPLEIGGSSIISRLDAATGSSHIQLGVKPEAKLRAILRISNVLGRMLVLEDVLQATLEGLFEIFPNADEGFILLKRTTSNKLVVKATKTRGTDDDTNVRISMTIVKQAMKSGEAILSADAAQDQRFVTSESLSSLQIRSVMCVPMIDKNGDNLGVIQVDTKGLGRQFSQDDLELLVSVASPVSLAIENSNMHEDMLRQRDVQRDLEFATQVQLGFLPNERPEIDEYQFHDYYEAALKVGGDYFDYIPFPDGRLAVAIGDVAGKGVPAALLMARLFSAVRFQLLTNEKLTDAMTGLNREISGSGLGHRFITCLLTVIDPKTHEATFVNAGHLPPILKTKKQAKAIGIKDSGMPLGIAEEQEFRATTYKLKSGESLLYYTDGITEAMDPDNDIYGSQRLINFIASGPDDVVQLVKGLMANIEEFIRERTQRDDICIVVARRDE